MTNNVVLIIIFLTLTNFMLPNYASAQTGSSNCASNGDQDGQYSNLGPTMEIVTVVLVCFFFLIGFLYVFFDQRFAEAPSALSSSSSSYAATIARIGTAPGGGGLHPALADSFPVVAYISVKELRSRKISDELECAVCLSEFQEFDSLKLLPKCNHVFHPECIDAWLASHTTCPVCRTNLEFKFKLEPDLCPRCSIIYNSNGNNDNVAPNSIESNLEQQPQAGMSVNLSSEN